MTTLKRLAIVAAVAVAAFAAFAASRAPDRASAPPDPAPHDDRHLLVKFEPRAGPTERAQAHRANRGTPRNRLRPQGVEVVEIAPGDTVAAATARYARDPRVEFAEPNRKLSLVATTNDVLFPGNGTLGGLDLWGFENTGQNGGRADADIDAPEGWQAAGVATGSPWPTSLFGVGVIDTGIAAGHEDLAGKVITPCYSALSGDGSLASGCNDDNGHGTHAAGTIAAVGNNGKGIVGVAPNAKVYACKALDAEGSGFVADIAACVNDAVSKRDAYNIRVLSLSLGGAASRTLAAAVESAWSAGVLVVAAAGNDGDGTISYPAGEPNAVSVAASDRADARAPFSNFNSDVELSAPGVDIVSTVPGGYGAMSGTSMATPHVAGVAALVHWRQGKTQQALRDALAAAVDDLGPAGRDPEFGYGRVNLAKAFPAAPAAGDDSGSIDVSPAQTQPAPTPGTTTLRPAGYRILSGTIYSGRGGLWRLGSNDGRRLELSARRLRSGTYVSDLYAHASMTAGQRASMRRLTFTYNGNASSSRAAVTLRVYRFRTGRWVTVFGPQRIGTSDRTVRWSPASAPRDYVSAAGAMRLRVRATRGAAFRTRTDLVRFTVEY